jgi:hypothetical protein
MADLHIDFDSPTNGVGSEADPYNAWPTLASDNNYWIKRGNDENTTRVDLNGLDNVTFGAYGSGADPILRTYFTSTSTGDWTEIATNIWQLDFGTEFFNPAYVVGLGELGTDNNPSWTERVNYNGVGTGTSGAGAFTEFGQWDTVVGTVGTTSKLHIYADANPVTKWGTIYYVRGQYPTFYDTGACTNITVQDIHFLHCYTSTRLDTSTGLIQKNTVSEHCWFGVRLGGTTNAYYHNNTIKRCGGVGVRLGSGMTNLIVELNNVLRTGIAEGIGGMYGQAQDSTRGYIVNNYVDGVVLSPYWSSEGRCIYMENSSSNITIAANHCKNPHPNQAAFHFNGGQSGVVLVGNLVEDALLGFNSSDALPTETDQFDVCNNVFKTEQGVRYARPTANGTMTTTLRNNILISPTGAGTGVFLDADVGTLGGVTESNNFVYNHAAAANGITLDSTTETAIDPDINDDGTNKRNSPTVGIGVRWWTGANPETRDEPLSDIDTDIGFQSAFSPFHPKKL